MRAKTNWSEKDGGCWSISSGRLSFVLVGFPYVCSSFGFAWHVASPPSSSSPFVIELAVSLAAT